MAKFRIYYGDGSIFTDGDEGHPPPYGVVCILQQRGYDERFFITSQTPYYMYVKGEWLPVWMNDVEDYLAHRLAEIECFLVGRMVPKYEFIKIYEQAKADRAKEVLG